MVNSFSNWKVQNLKGFVLGSKTDIGAFSYINAMYGVVIKDNVQIGSHCSVYSFSTIKDSYGKVILKHNCRIGSHSIIGAHSLVNKDIPDNVDAFGVLAKVVSQLNNDE